MEDINELTNKSEIETIQTVNVYHFLGILSKTTRINVKAIKTNRNIEIMLV